MTFNGYVEPISKSGQVELSVLNDTYEETDGSLTILINWNGVENPYSSIEVYTKNITTDSNDIAFDKRRIEINTASGSLTLEIELLDDDLIEETETFEVGLRHPVGVNLSSEPKVISLFSNDLEPKGNVQISGSIDTNEGSVETLTLARIGGTRGVIEVDLIITLDTASQNDYELSSDTVTFQDGEITKDVSLTIIDDTLEEGVERFSIEISTSDQESSASGSVSVTVSASDSQPTSQPEAQPQPQNESGGGSIGGSFIFLSIIMFARRYRVRQFSKT